MPYNQNLANRIREKLSELPNIEEKAMFGGLTFMYNGKMLVGIMKDELMCRIDPLHEMVLEKNGCRTMEFGNGAPKRMMKGYVLVDETGIKNDEDLIIG